MAAHSQASLFDLTVVDGITHWLTGFSLGGNAVFKVLFILLTRPVWPWHVCLVGPLIILGTFALNQLG